MPVTSARHLMYCSVVIVYHIRIRCQNIILKESINVETNFYEHAILYEIVAKNVVLFYRHDYAYLISILPIDFLIHISRTSLLMLVVKIQLSR